VATVSDPRPGARARPGGPPGWAAGPPMRSRPRIGRRRSARSGSMGFRLGNVDGRAVLVEGDGVFDLERVSEGRLGPGARAAIAGHAVLHEVAAGLAGQQPDRTLADVTLGPPQPDPW